MKRILLIFLVFLLQISVHAQDEKLKEIISQLKTYYQYNPGEKVFLTTNKEVFKSGETVWFNALVKLYTSPNYNNLTPSLTIKLFSEDGISLFFDNFKIDNGRAEGDFVVPEGLEPGKYFIAAITQVARNEEDVYLKMIFIEPKDEAKVQVEPVAVPGLLTAGEINKLHYSLREISGEPCRSNRVKYKLYENGELIDEGKLKTEKNGHLFIQLDVPEKVFEYPLNLLVTDNSGHLNYKETFQVDAEKIHVKFYAEGGSYIAGIPVKIGYTVTNGAGQQIEISGEIIDEDENCLTQTQTLVPGYGIFPFIGESSKSYKMHVSSDLGNNQVFEIPPFKNEGMSLSLQKISDGFVELGLRFADKAQHSVYVMASKGDQVFWASEMNINRGVLAKIPKEDFQHGISHISVFNKEGQLLGDRLVYVDMKGALDVDIKMPEEQVRSGEPIILKVDVLTKDGDEVNSTLSASVSIENENLQGVNELESCFPINTELKNKIPVARLISEGAIDENSINYLLISNQLKVVDWESILTFDPDDIAANEKGVKGFVYDAAMNPVKNAKVSLVNSKNMQMLTKSTNDKGSFFFSGLDPANTNDYVVKAIDEEGRENLNIKFEKNFDEKLSDRVKKMSSYLSFVRKPEISTTYFNDNRALFAKFKKQSVVKKHDPAYKAYLQTATSLLEVIRIIKPFDLMGGKIVFKGSLNSFNAQDGALIVMDGQQLGTNASSLDGIAPLDIESINVSTNPMDIQKYTGLNSVGVIEIVSKRGESPTFVETENPYKYANGYRIPNDFMTRRIDENNLFSTTLLWNPEIYSDAPGSLNLEIPTNSVIGDFKIEIEAIDKNGRIGKASKTVRVVK